MKRMHENFPRISSVLFRVRLRWHTPFNDPDLVVMEVKRLKERPNDRATGAIERKEQHDESSA